MTTNWQQPPGGPPPSPSPNNQDPAAAGKGPRFAIVAVLLVVIAGLAAGAGLFMANRDSGNAVDDERFVLTETVAESPVFEPRDARGADPFFPLEVQLVSFQEEQEDEAMEEAEELLEGAEPGQQVQVPEFDVAALDEAVKTGLYGGTEENTCDPERLISFLYANPELGEAWAKVQGIEFAEIADYIRSLEVRVLAEPANVLNHGFDPATGAPYEIDTILDAGTAVLVDKDGEIRTRCYCGNPIKPKPPEHMPPRCIVWLEHVYVAPGGGDRREDVVRDVLLTGRETTVGGAVWVEVKWGNNDDEQGWVRSDNLRNHYCPPDPIEWQCPGPDDVPVYANPDAATVVGYHEGVLQSPAGNVHVFGPVEPVGAPNPLIVDDFMMIHFKQAAPSVNNSAWIRTSDLAQDDENCFRLPMCVNTEGPVWERAGGALHSAGGLMKVEFTGRFVTNIETHAEVRLVEEGGTHAWISKFYTALDDEECEGPELECVSGFPYAIVWPNSTDVGLEHVGYIYDAIVDVTGPAENGRFPVEMATPGGPAGWIDEVSFNANLSDCVPRPACFITTGPAYAEYPANGAMIGAIAVPRVISVVGKLTAPTVDNPVTYERIRVDGVNYWIDWNDLVPVADEDCRETDPECPSYGYPDDDGRAPSLEDILGSRTLDESAIVIVEPGQDPERPVVTECCVTALYETPSTAFPVGGLFYPVEVTVFGSVTVDNGGGDEVWFVTSTGHYFMDIHVLPISDCVGECPEANDVPTVADVLGDGDLPDEKLLGLIAQPMEDPVRPGPSDDCCISGAAVDRGPAMDAPGPWPRFVEVLSGPHEPLPGWYLTVEGDWFTAAQVLPASACQPIECPEPMIPGLYDLASLQRDEERTVALSTLYAGDTAECCAEGEIYSSPDFGDATGGELTEPTTVTVIEVGGDWYHVVIQDFVAWIHVSQFLDFDECEGPGSNCPSLDEFQGVYPDADPSPQDGVACCIQGFALTMHPADAAPGDFVSINPAVEATLVAILADVGGGPWYEFGTDDYGTVWTRSDSIVDMAACVPDVECPGDSFVALAIADDFENGVSINVYSCCVSFNSPAAGPGFKVVTLTGETSEVAGVVSYVTTDGEVFQEVDFADAERCTEQTCPDGQTIVQDLDDCPRPSVTCPDGSVGRTLDDCPAPPPSVTCPDGSLGRTLADCPAPPPSVTCPDGSVGRTIEDCPLPPPSCERDLDQDGACDAGDNCVQNPNPNQEDSDGDGVGDACDNCTFVRNAGQENFDGDTIGDACDNCPFDTNGFQEDSDGDGTGDVCETPDCPSEQLLDNGQCCPTDAVADGSQCFCASGFEVRPGDTCPPPCPQERQLPSGQCCPAGTTAGSVDCFCPDQSLPVAGVGCTKECPGGNRVPVADSCPPVIGGSFTTLCPSDRLRGDGQCCPAGLIAWQSPATNQWECVEELF